MRKITTKQFVEKSQNLYGNLYDYSKVNYINSHTKIILIDKEYGDFSIFPYDHFRGRGHKLRGFNKISIKNSSDKKTFIKKARKVHGDLYDYSKVNYINNRTKITIIDPLYGEFLQTPAAHLRGQGNPYRNSGIKFTTKKFIEKSRKVHGDLYDYSKVNYINKNTPVIIIDPIYGEFEQKPKEHLGGSGCTKRSIKKSSLKRSKTTKEFIEKSRKIHGNLYDYSKVDYVNSRTNVIIIDPLYGEFEQNPSNHLKGRGNIKRINKKYFELDHIIPISFLCNNYDRNYNILKNDILYKLFDSSYNTKYISSLQNRTKSDNVILFGNKIKARNYRNDYEIIRYLFLREHNITLADYIK